jgi:hypothetical protein
MRHRFDRDAGKPYVFVSARLKDSRPAKATVFIYVRTDQFPAMLFAGAPTAGSLDQFGWKERKWLQQQWEVDVELRSDPIKKVK